MKTNLNARRLPALNLRTLTPNTSLRVPVLPQNWAYLRALRQAELAAWNGPTRPARTAAATNPSLAQSVAEVSRWDVKERSVYGLIAVLAIAAAGYGLWSSLQFTTHWTTFVQFVRQLVG
jgi:hypothetical protein